MNLFKALETYYYNIVIPNKKIEDIYNIELQEAFLKDLCNDTVKSRIEVNTYCQLIRKINIIRVLSLGFDKSHLKYKERYSDVINQRYYDSIVDFLYGLIKKSTRRRCNKEVNHSPSIINYHNIKLNFLGESDFTSFINNNSYISLEVSRKEFEENLNLLVRRLKLKAKRINKIFHGFLINNGNVYALFTD